MRQHRHILCVETVAAAHTSAHTNKLTNIWWGAAALLQQCCAHQRRQTTGPHQGLDLLATQPSNAGDSDDGECAEQGRPAGWRQEEGPALSDVPAVGCWWCVAQVSSLQWHRVSGNITHGYTSASLARMSMFTPVAPATSAQGPNTQRGCCSSCNSPECCPHADLQPAIADALVLQALDEEGRKSRCCQREAQARERHLCRCG